MQIETHLSPAALACVDKAFGEVLSTVLVGGRAVGLVRPNSDIDLMVLTDNTDVPSLPFKFPTPDGVCEVEYHSALVLRDRLASFENSISELALASGSYGNAKFLAETASRLRTGDHIAGMLSPTLATGMTNEALEEICVRWVWFRYWMIDLTLDLLQYSTGGLTAHLRTEDIAGIAFERSCRAAMVELVCTERSFYISGRYKWLGTLLARHDRCDVWSFLSQTRKLRGNQSAISSSDPKNSSLVAFEGFSESPRKFRLAPCPGGRLITISKTETLLESADRCIVSICPKLAVKFGPAVTLEDLSPDDCDRLAELIRRRFVWIIPEL
jgi:hypothetical protein